MSMRAVFDLEENLKEDNSEISRTESFFIGKRDLFPLGQIKHHHATKKFVPPNVPEGKKINIEMSVGTVLLAAYEDSLLPYGHNRGQGGILAAKEKTSNTVKKVREGYNPLLIGLLILCVDESGICIMAEGHMRIKGLILRAIDGNLTNAELEDKIVIQFSNIADYMMIYSGVNDQKPHSASEKSFNPDLALGHVNSSILEQCKDIKMIREHFMEKLGYSLAYCSYAKIKKREELYDFWKLFAECRNEVKGWSNIEAQYAPFISERTCKEIASAIDEYMKFVVYLKKEKEKQRKEERNYISSILNSSSLFSLVVLDIISGQRVLVGKRGMEAFAERCLNHKSYLADNLPCITNGSNRSVEKAVIRLIDKLGPKS